MMNSECLVVTTMLLIVFKGQRKKSKREVMREVIAKSKLHRHEKAKEFDENCEKKIELDKEFQHLLDKKAFGTVLSNPAEVVR